jgi:ribosomal protein S18 acetylase RimI-like enzyme
LRGVLTIRPAHADELDALADLTEAAYAADGMPPPTAAHYVDELRDTVGRAATAELLVAADADGALLGTVTFCSPDSPWSEVSRPGEAEFRMLAVPPAARGSGVGEALTRACVERARGAGAQRLVLSAMAGGAAARRLYERLGFARLPERDWSPVDGVSLVAYGLEL